nr:hypothetical protein [Tanacetum cinerariifolium]
MRQDTKEIQPSGPTTNVEDEAFNEENVSQHSNDPLHNGEDKIQLKKLMDLCKKMSDRVLNLETTKIAQAKEIANLKKRVKRLERKRKSRSHRLKRLYKVGLSTRVESSANEESLNEDIFGVNDQDDTSMFNADKDLQGEEVVVKEVNAASITTLVSAAATTTTAATTPTISMDEITLAKALIEIKTSRPKAKGLVMQELSETPTPTPTPIMKKKDQILFDKEVARKLHEEIYKKEGLVGERARQEEDANNALIETYEDIQAKMDVDYQLAERLHEKEQEQFTDAEKAKLFMEFIEKRRKFFAAKRDEEIRKKPPTKVQQRKLNWWRRVQRRNVPVETTNSSALEIAQESSSKRAGDELEQEIAKKQRIEDENDSA